MSQTFYTLLTAIGEAKHANAVATGTKVNYSAMAVGDGNGNATLPDRMQTSLVNEVRRAAINQVGIDPDNDAQIIVEQVIPENVGGWWIREVGIFDDDGDLIAVANVPPTYKPQLQEGSGRTQVVRVVLLVSSTAAVAIKIDPSIVLATQQYVNDVFDSIPEASTAEPGLIELATIPEAKVREDKRRAITPETLGAVLDTYYATFAEITALIDDEGPIICIDQGGAVYVWEGSGYAPLIADETYAGSLKVSTSALALALADDQTAITPKKLSAVLAANVLGMGQTWQNFTGSRAKDTTYTNTTGGTIAVSVVATVGVGNDIVAQVGGQNIGRSSNNGSGMVTQTLFMIVPPGATYRFAGGTTIQYWTELR